MAHVTCSNGLLVLMPFPPTKIQLSLKPRLLIAVLPRSAISFLASSLSLQNKEDRYYFMATSAATQPLPGMTKAIYIHRVNLNCISRRWGCCGKSPYFVEGSSNEAIITTVPSSISFRNLIKGATSKQALNKQG